jgi:D-alanyl-D-alanine endopeptidase (penicillin-binding protein 7)
MKTRVGNRPLVMVLLNSQGKLTPLGDANRIKRWLEGNPTARRSGGNRRA